MLSVRSWFKIERIQECCQKGVLEIVADFFVIRFSVYQEEPQAAYFVFLGFKLCFSVTEWMGRRENCGPPAEMSPLWSVSRCPARIHSLCSSHHLYHSRFSHLYLKTCGLSSQDTNMGMLELCLVVTQPDLNEALQICGQYGMSLGYQRCWLWGSLALCYQITFHNFPSRIPTAFFELSNPHISFLTFSQSHIECKTIKINILKKYIRRDQMNLFIWGPGI